MSNNTINCGSQDNTKAFLVKKVEGNRCLRGEEGVEGLKPVKPFSHHSC
ncbi:hypothetical protein [Liberibacter phage P-PA19-2]|nr:hypothetical protein [Liberibacter phage P-PA19-2]